jgi:hypothetical protein
LPADGRLITLELDPKHAEVTRASIARAGLADVVELRVGRALETLPQLVAEHRAPFDFIFIDADKENYPGYFSWALTLSRRGTLIVADNVVRKGAVVDAASNDPNVQGVRRFLELLAAERRVNATAMQTVGSKGYDGFTLAVVTGEVSEYTPATLSNQLENIDAELADWIARQRVFFVATAPLSPGGHINASPKGGDAFRTLGPMEVVYHDYTGSGAETAAHLRENGRMVIMFCAFEGPPRIVRLHGRGTIITPDHPQFAALAKYFPPNPGTRAFVHVAVTRVSTSCGYGVPLLDFGGHRDALSKWAISKGPKKLKDYRANKNQKSIDGLPAFDREG